MSTPPGTEIGTPGTAVNPRDFSPEAQDAVGGLRGRRFVYDKKGIVDFRGKKHYAYELKEDEDSGGRVQAGVDMLAQFALGGPIEAGDYQQVGFYGDQLSKIGSGKVTKTIYVAAPQAAQPKSDTKTLGYNPNRPGSNREDSIGDYMQKPDIRSRLRDAGNGDLYLIENRRVKTEGKTTVLVAPGGDFSKAVSKQFFTSSTDGETNGKPLTNTSDQIRAVRSYLLGETDALYEKEVPELALKLGQDRNKAEEKKSAEARRMLNLEEGSADLEDLKKEIRARKGPVTIDVKHKQVRFYDKETDANLSMSSYRTGTAVDVSDSAGKEWDRLHDLQMEHKEDLGGERAFAGPPPKVGPTSVDDDEADSAQRVVSHSSTSPDSSLDSSSGSSHRSSSPEGSSDGASRDY